jgi:putative oxidoreductase
MFPPGIFNELNIIGFLDRGLNWFMARLLLLGLFTRIASIPLLIVILTAIATTKIPELFRPGQGFWFMVSDARTDFAMTTSLLFLISVGAGSWSLDAWLRGQKTAPDY